jgi:hypothetical protein
MSPTGERLICCAEVTATNEWNDAFTTPDGSATQPAAPF